MDEPLILALDQGTTSSRSILVDPAGRIVASASAELPQIFPAPGEVEHDPEGDVAVRLLANASSGSCSTSPVCGKGSWARDDGGECDPSEDGTSLGEANSR